MQVGLLNPFMGIEWNIGKQFIPVDPEEPIFHRLGDTQVKQSLELAYLVAQPRPIGNMDGATHV